ncbi:MAG: helix-turn-helix domain-containing protein [Candidatus Dormibacter sp.]|uniref:helix-turn-helix domain-containing protein n=1 Tax=Candidatus Dormibacter sp. TaxID=2973982 RepID=UPI0026A34871
MIRIRADELRYQAALRGWDQRSLARAAGVSEGTVSRLLTGSGVRPSTLLRLARALKKQPALSGLEAVVDRSAP